MKSIVTTYLNKFKQAHVRRRRLLSVLVLLAFLAGLGVTWQMRLEGLTLSDEVAGGTEEHQHDASCYTQKLICGPNDPSAAHEHDENCYETSLICAQETNSHAVSCLSDVTDESASAPGNAVGPVQSPGSEPAQAAAAMPETSTDAVLPEESGETSGTTSEEILPTEDHAAGQSQAPVETAAVMTSAEATVSSEAADSPAASAAAEQPLAAEGETTLRSQSQGTSAVRAGQTAETSEQTAEPTEQTTETAEQTAETSEQTALTAAAAGAAADRMPAETTVLTEEVTYETGSAEDSPSGEKHTQGGDQVFPAPAGTRSEGAAAAAPAVTAAPAVGLLKAANAVRLSNNLRAGEPQDLTPHLTSVIVSKIVNGEYLPVDTVTDGDTVRVRLNYVIDEGVIDASQGKTSMIYQLPDGLQVVQAESGFIMDAGVRVGTYSIDPVTRRVSMQFYDAFATGRGFSGYLQFDGRAERESAGTDGQIEFIGEDNKVIKTVTVNEGGGEPSSHDLTVSKQAGQITADENSGKLRIPYTVTAASEHGTEGTVKLSDKLLKTSQGSFSYDKSSLHVYKVKGDQRTELTDFTVTYSGETAASQDSFVINELPALEAGEKYELKYDVLTDGRLEDGSAKLANEAAGGSGEDKPNVKVETQVHPPVLNKWGSYDAGKNVFNWTVKIENPHKLDLAGYKLKDYLPADTAITGTVSIKDDSWQIIKTISAQELINGYTLPADSNSRFYEFSYQTTAPAPVNGKVTATNKAELENSVTYTAETTATGDARKWELWKGSAGEGPATAGVRKLYWSANMTIPADWSSLLLEDKIEQTTDKAGQPLPDVLHYAQAAELDAYIRAHLKFKTESGGEFGFVNDYLDITLAYFDADGRPVPAADNTQQVRRFTISVQPKENTVPPLLSKMELNNYPTIIDDSALEAGQTAVFKNTVSLPQTSLTPVTATKEKSKIKKLEKQGGLWDYAAGYREFDYNPQAQTIQYRIILKPDPGENADLILYDYLPPGTKLTDKADDRWAAFYKDAYTTPGSYTGAGEHYSFQSWDTAIYKPVSWETEESEQGTRLKIRVQGGYKDAVASGLGICLQYKVSFADDPDLLKPLELKKYSNRIEWGTESSTSEIGIKKRVENIKKTGGRVPERDAAGHIVYETKPDGSYVLDEQGKKVPVFTNRVRYVIPINPLAKDFDPNSDVLNLTDVARLSAGMMAYLDMRSLGLYEMDLSKEEYIGNPLDPSRYTARYDVSAHKLEMTVPDKLACVLVYEYVVDEGTAASPRINNTVDLNGQFSSSSEVDIIVSSSGAGVFRGMLTLFKVDGSNYNKLLPGAEFAISAYTKNADGSYSWSEPLKAGSNEDGEIILNLNQEPAAANITPEDPQASVMSSFKVNYGVLYKIIETKAPAGYRTQARPYYIIWKGDEHANNEAAFRAAGGGSETITDTDGITPIRLSDVLFYKYSNTVSLYVENESSRVEVRKIFLNMANQEIGPQEEAIEVELWRKTANGQGEYTGLTAVLNNDNGWHYYWDDLPKQDAAQNLYLYYVKEIPTGNAYDVSYHNNDGITKGEIVIVNHYRDYKLPETGGPGTLAYTAGGTILTASAAMLLLKKKKRGRGS